MKFRKQPKTSPATQAEDYTTPAHKWTRGAHLGTRALNAALVVALLCGPIGLGYQLYAAQNTQVVTASQNSSSDAQQSTSAYAEGFVLAWLRATRDSVSELAAYIELPNDQLPAKPFTVSDASTLSVVSAGYPDLYSVTVKVRISEPGTKDLQGATAKAEVKAPVWRDRYFKVLVHSGDDGLKVSMLPAPISAPSVGAFPAMSYASNLPLSGPVGDAVQAFFGAYLCGVGELNRYISPGSPLRPLVPAPYTAVTIKSINSVQDAPEKPKDGSKLNVIVTVKLSAAALAGPTSDFALTLTARAGRWEITDIPPGPQISTSQPTAPPTQ